MKNKIADAILKTLETPNEMDRNMETPANIVDGIFRLSMAIENLTEILRIAHKI